MRCLLSRFALFAFSLAVCLIGAAPAGGNLVPGISLDGPSADIAPNNGPLDLDVAMAPDGTGAIAYVKEIGGIDAIMVTRRVAGQWLAPERVSDAAAVLDASQPKVAAADGGKVVVLWRHFPNTLLSAVRDSSGSTWGAPVDVTGFNVVNVHDIAINASGVAYAAYVTGGVGDLRAARLGPGGWQWVGTDPDPANNGYLSPTGVLDASPPADVGGNSQTGPEVAVSQAGDAVVAWTEGSVATDQAVFVRRIEGTQPASGAVRATTPSLDGAPDTGTNDMIDLGLDAAGNAWVAWRFVVQYGGTNHGRAALRQLVGDSLGPVQVRDGLPVPPAEAAEFPSLGLAPDGTGLLAVQRQLTFGSFGSVLGSGQTAWGPSLNLNGPDPPASGVPRAAATGGGRGLFVWREELTLGARKVKARVQSESLASAIELSDPGFGTAGTTGPEVAASSDGTVAVAFVQGEAAQKRLIVSEVKVPKAVVPTSRVAKASGLRVQKRIRKTGRPAKRVRRGGQIRFRLATASRFRLRFHRIAPGRKVGKRCVAPRRRNAKRPRCSRAIQVPGAITMRGAKGINRVRFGGRINARRALKPGRYRLSLTVLDASGKASRPARAAFRLIRSKPARNRR